MAGLWGADLLDRIKGANPIVDVVGAYVPLKRAGRKFKGLSPFKSEKTPSFFVDDAQQLWYCFSTQQGGDVIKFIQVQENLDFASAVRMLARRANIPLPEGDSVRYSNGEGSGLRELIFNALDLTSEWWHQRLLNAPDAEHARSYLERRGLSWDTVREFQIGHAPAGWETTLAHLRKEGIPETIAEKAGIIKARDKDGRTEGQSWYDIFRDRLILPIRSEAGQIIGFSGRALENASDAPKYINSPETPVFVKGRIFFGISHHKRELLDTRRAIVCEGPLDLITCHQHGVRNLVANQGTAFTDQHAAILKRHVDEVVLCFDSDDAGRRAVIRSIPPLLKVGLPARVLELPSAENGTKHDPDSFVRAHGPSAFRELAEAAPDFWSAFLNRLSAEHSVREERGRMAIKRAYMELAVQIADPAEKDRAFMLLAARIGSTLDILRNEARSHRTTHTPQFADDEREPVVEYREEPLPPPHPAIAELTMICMNQPQQVIPEIQALLDPAWIESLDGSWLLLRILNDYTHDAWESPQVLLQQLSGEEQNALAALLARTPPELQDPQDLPMRIRVLEKLWLDREIRRLDSALRTAGTMEEIQRIMKELLDFRMRRDKVCDSLS
jgi:DNA primase